MASERGFGVQTNEDPSVQLSIVQDELRSNDTHIAHVEDAWSLDPANQVLKAMHERLSKREQLLLEERKIWAGASLQNNSWQAGFSNSVGFKELLKRMAQAAATGSAHELLSFERHRGRSRPGTKQVRASSHMPSEAPGKQLLMLCDAAEATESYGQGLSEWRGTHPGKYTEPWTRESPQRRRAADFSGQPSKKHRSHTPKYSSVVWDGLAYEVPVRIDTDEGIAAYVRAKLNLGADESCTEREPPNLAPSLSDDLKGATSLLSDYLKDQDYGAAMSGGTKMSQQGNVTPGRSDNGAVTMPAQYEIATYPTRNGFMDYPIMARPKPARSDTSGRSLRQNTQLPSRYDENQFALQPH